MTASTMRGLVLDPRAPHSVRLRDDLPVPDPRPGEIRVRVTHSTVNGHELELALNPLVRGLGWLRGARGEVRTGLEFSGVVDIGGELFDEGESVMGYVEITAGARPHADYVVIPEIYVAPAPRGMPLAEAAALPMSALTALVAITRVARVRPGHEVLILGASGGVGVMAVQIARIVGASVTAVASSPHHDALHDLGATRTIDYRNTPVGELTGRYDAVLDFTSRTDLREVRHLLSANGVFVPADPFRNLGDVLGSRRAKWLMVDRGDGLRLQRIARWVEADRLGAVVSEVFEMSDWEAAVARSHERGRLGRTVLAFDS
ncbi:MAG: NAD(P)-dependent alcohol dehydrogenase [Myxococcota bacterium]